MADNYEYNLDKIPTEQLEKYKNIDLESITTPFKNKESSLFFNKFHWLKIENFISEETADILYNHVKHNAIRLDVLSKDWHNKSDEDKQLINQIWGTFEDTQAMGDYSKYGDPIFDSFLEYSNAKIGEIINKKLLSNYTYHRLYTTDTELVRHKDRASCEISTTLCLGFDNQNVNEKQFPNYNWPMWIESDTGEKTPIQMNPGDMLIYRGCEVWHWREHFKGNNHAQLFMHFNEESGNYNIKYDGRPFLGLPSNYRDEKSVEINNVDNDFVK